MDSLCRGGTIGVLFLLVKKQSITDKTIAFTLAVAMRNAAARILGIEVRELGCEIKWIEDNVQKGRSEEHTSELQSH